MLPLLLTACLAPTEKTPIGGDDSGGPDDTGTHGVLVEASPSVHIIVEPSDNASALIDAISGATTSVHMEMYILSSDDIIGALQDANSNGADVQVVLNHDFPNGDGSNYDAYDALESSGVSVSWASSDYTYTHQKSVIIDDREVWIMTMNASYSSPRDNREFLAVDTDPEDIADAEALFAADVAQEAFAYSGRLVVSPVNARTRLLGLLSAARTTLDVEDEELSDSAVTSTLAARSRAGVTVRIVVSDGYPSDAQTTALTELKAAGAEVVTCSDPFIHAKAIVADGVEAYVGSQNLTFNSIDYNRELGVFFDDPAEVATVLDTFETDFGNGRAY